MFETKAFGEDRLGVIMFNKTDPLTYQGLSNRERQALSILSLEERLSLCLFNRYKTGLYIGYELTDGLECWLPADVVKYDALGVLNDELRKKNPGMRFEEQVWFVEEPCCLLPLTTE